MPLVPLIPVDRCRVGRGTFVSHAGLGLAVFLLEHPERAFVIDHTCPHAGGSLAEGSLSGTIVSCPYHYWEFDLVTGRCTNSNTARLRSYEAELRDGVVWADLPDGRA